MQREWSKLGLDYDKHDWKSSKEEPASEIGLVAYEGHDLREIGCEGLGRIWVIEDVRECGVL